MIYVDALMWRKAALAAGARELNHRRLAELVHQQRVIGRVR